MKIWTCYSGLAAQQWTYSNGKLSLQNTDQCLDLPGANAANGNYVQTWKCNGGNSKNQQWTTSGKLTRRQDMNAAFANVVKASCDKKVRILCFYLSEANS